MWPKTLALGAATGTPARFNQRDRDRVRGHANCRQEAASGCDGVGNRAWIVGNSNVSGPGQKAWISFSAFSGISAVKLSNIGFFIVGPAM